MSPISDVRQAYETHPAGTTIFTEGDAGDQAYVIDSGRVEIGFSQAGRRTPIAVLGIGEIFGEMALIDDRVRSATATALTEVDLIPIHRDYIRSALKDSDPTIGLLLKVLLGRFRSMQGKIFWASELSEADKAEPVQTLSSEHHAVIERVKIESELRHALTGEEFSMVLQPVVSLSDGEVAGFEALIRWRHPERGLVPPPKFIQVAESTDLIKEIDLWVFDRVLALIRDLREWFSNARADRAPPYVAINLSGASLSDDGVIGAMLDRVRKTGVDPASIRVEITEGVLIHNPIEVSMLLDRLRDMGIRISLDDFGTGYSALSYLVAFPIDMLKIDRTFVNAMLKSKNNLEMVRAIVGMAHGLKMQVVAEGCESVEELKALWRMECEYVQGFMLSEPLESKRAVEFAAAGSVMTWGPIFAKDRR